MIGPYVNGVALFVGSAAGAMLGPRLTPNLRQRMPLVFGCACIGLGITMIVKVKFLAPVVLALVVGSFFGELIELESRIQRTAQYTRSWIDKVTRPVGNLSQEEFMDKFIALLILFCMSGTGIYGSLSEGMTGDPTLLIVKAILDLFTAPIFAASMGFSVCILVIPQFVIQGILYLAASMILPLTTPDMLSDFAACGGLIMLATGLRISGIQHFPVAGMIPSLVFVMPLSWLWSVYLG